MSRELKLSSRSTTEAVPAPCSVRSGGRTSPGIFHASQQLDEVLSKGFVAIPYPPYNCFYLFILSVELKSRGRRSASCSGSCTVRLNRKSSPKILSFDVNEWPHRASMRFLLLAGGQFGKLKHLPKYHRKGKSKTCPPPPPNIFYVPFQVGANSCGREKCRGGRRRNQWCDLSLLHWKTQSDIKP